MSTVKDLLRELSGGESFKGTVLYTAGDNVAVKGPSGTVYVGSSIATGFVAGDQVRVNNGSIVGKTRGIRRGRVYQV